MNRKITFNLKVFAVATIISSLVTFGFYSNEARKEVYYLCGNLSKDTSYSSVIRQLNTINLSEYRVEELWQGKRIIHSSKLNFHLFRCNIEFNTEEKVTSVSYN
ncbi:hypothetical protein GCM10025772_10100 [Ferrimonas gelatinilytica]|uniref:Uncharacterized protein n=1 Tax=Ferrimonas gelatinilytica TaxID=1255257 RepID=A0ABP9S072_9GAMM